MYLCRNNTLHASVLKNPVFFHIAINITEIKDRPIAMQCSPSIKNAPAARFQVAETSAADPQIRHPMERDNEQYAQQDSTL